MVFDLSQIKLLVGLGNVGKQYAQTRHNAGFMFVDALLSALTPDAQWKQETELHTELSVVHYQPAAVSHQLILAKPTTMMNLSGRAVAALANYYKLKPAEILIAHDDLDIAIGEYKIQLGKGPKVHNGIDSVEKHMGPNFWRLRIGIENREVKGNKLIAGMDYALQKFPQYEQKTVNDTISIIISELTS